MNIIIILISILILRLRLILILPEVFFVGVGGGFAPPQKTFLVVLEVEFFSGFLPWKNDFIFQ